MTIRQLFEQRLFECFMLPDQAAAVIDAVISAKENEAMEGRWNEDQSAYPPALLAVLWFSVRKHALAWIDANCPNAFYRGMFVDDPQANECTTVTKETP